MATQSRPRSLRGVPDGWTPPRIARHGSRSLLCGTCWTYSNRERNTRSTRGTGILAPFVLLVFRSHTRMLPEPFYSFGRQPVPGLLYILTICTRDADR